MWATIGSAGVVAGMLFGGILVELLGWRSVLWVNVPVCAALVVLVPLVVPRDLPLQDKPKLDVAGAALLTALLLLVTYTVVRAPEEGVSSPATLLCAAETLVLAVALLALERRRIRPLVPSRLFRKRPATPARRFMRQFIGSALPVSRR